MREIKFRAWDKLKKSVHEVVGINWIEGIVLLWKQTGTARSTYYVEIDTVEFIQYTGLKDKNGKEIYEGDIITNPECEHPYQVIFCYGSFDVNWPGCCEHCAKGNASHGSLNEMLAFEKDTEVVGNIYENSELLKR